MLNCEDPLIEDVLPPDRSVDVVISNCVTNLSIDQPKVFTEMFRILSLAVNRHS